MEMSPVKQKFILHWGDMGARWGINRTVAQIHALLFLSNEPMHAEDIANTLKVARSNVSMSLRELQSWGIVRTVPVLGDRRDHFESMTDVWEMFEKILDERKRRECDPTLKLLGECLAEAERDGGDKHVRRRLEQMHEFFSTMTTWYDQMRRLPRGTLRSFFKMGAKVKRMLGLAS